MEISGVTIEGSTIVAPPPPPGGSLSFNFNNLAYDTKLYTSNFTPPSVPITPNANCKLLLLVKTDPTKFADSSGTNKTISNPVTTVAFSSDTPFTY